MKAVKIILAIIAVVALFVAEALTMGLFALDEATSEESVREALTESDIVSQLVDEALAEGTLKLQPVVRQLPFGEPATEESFAGLLEDETVWGTDLKAAGLIQRVVEDFNLLNAGPGAVRKTLHEAVSEAN